MNDSTGVQRRSEGVENGMKLKGREKDKRRKGRGTPKNKEKSRKVPMNRGDEFRIRPRREG
jgi:hypothetical protein